MQDCIQHPKIPDKKGKSSFLTAAPGGGCACAGEEKGTSLTKKSVRMQP